MTHRRLLVVRHAQAEPYVGSDHERALTAKGLRAARGVGQWLAEHEFMPDYALVSSATRTRQTWAAIADSADRPIHAEFSDDLYHAGVDDVVDALRWVPVNAQTIAYVGHNPTAGQLPHLLDDGAGDRRLLEEIATGYPTAAVSVFAVGTDWSDLGFGTARLTDFFVGGRSI